MKRIVGTLVAAGAISVAGLTAGCGTTTYTGGCLPPLNESQIGMVRAYKDAHGADAQAFIDKGNKANVCRAIHDPYEPKRGTKPAEPERVDLEFDGTWTTEQALVVGYALSGLPDKPGAANLKVATQQTVLLVRNGTSNYKWAVDRQEAKFRGKTVEIETDQEVPDKVTFTL